MQNTAQYILTSANWDGQILLEYDYTGRLVSYRLDAELTPAQYDYFIAKFPFTTDHANALLQAVPTLSARLIPCDLSFEKFWNAYDYKVGNKQRSHKLWEKMNTQDRIACLESIKHYDRYLQYKRGIEKLYPETYLSQRRWEVEYKKLVKG